MTYQEIKDRLSKCELTLEKLKNGANLNTPEVQKEIKKLTVLKESYQKHLDEKSNLTAFIDGRAVDIEDKKDLDKFKDNKDIDSIETGDGKKIKENEGTKFSVEETKAIAKKVGKAVAKALRDLGDAVHSMKAKNIEENSFEIEVNYKGQGPNDEFSFYVVDDTLHLVDFSFDKELVDVGVKPSGEAIVHVDHLANELTKHFKSLNEDEEEDAKNDADYEAGWTDDPRMDEAAYTEPKHFDICPGAETLRNKLIDGGKTPEELSDWTRLHDDLFKLEKAVIKANKADDKHVQAASKLRERIIHISRDLGIEAEDITYLKSHVEKIKDIADGKSLNEAPDGLYYIKVPRRDKAQLNAVQNTIETIYHPTRFTDIVDDDGAGNVIMYFPKEDFEPGMIDDLEGEGVDISSQTNLPRGLSEDDDDYKYDGEHQGSNYKWPMSQATKDRKEADKLNRKDEDTDIGHQDDEPDMLKQAAYDIATYASKLYRALDKYDKYDGEVDFPNWWQSKLILARDYVSKAQHYLEFEEKQPAIDKLALEGKVNEAMSPEQKEAIYDLENILDQAAQLGDEARDIIKQHFPNELSAGDAYDVFNFGSSSNSYDKTLETLISDIQRIADEEDFDDDDLDEGVGKIQKAHSQLVKQMKDLAARYKAGDKEVVKQLKDLTAKKKRLEQELDKAVRNTGRNQQLAEGDKEAQQAYYDVRDLIQKHARKLNDDDAYTFHELLKDFFNRLMESGPGFKHDCAAKVVHEKYGAGTCIPEKHTLVKEGKKYVVTHYDVLFESGKTVEDIPVSELDIKTQTEHWHKGYKKKKKD